MEDIKNQENANNQREKIRILVNTMYDIQKLRIATGNRLAASYLELGNKSRCRTAESVKNQKLMIDAESKKADAEKQKVINNIKVEYKRITDEIAGKVKSAHLPSDATIEKAINAVNGKDCNIKYLKTAYDYELATNYMQLVKSEETACKVLTKQVTKHPMWSAFFENVRGCGPVIAGVCIAYFDIDKARHASSFWRYAGLDVVTSADGKQVGHDKKYLVDQTYIDADGNEKTCKGLGYNPFLKSKLVKVLGGCIIKSGNGSGYDKAYRDYMNRLENRADTKDYTKLHKHNMAMRFMVKQFVRDMWVVWRGLAGYEVSEPYEVAFLGRKHHNYNEALEKYGK